MPNSTPPRIPRRTVLAGAAATAALATLAGCGSSDSSDGTSGGTLTAGFDNEPVTLDPALSSAISSDRNVLNLFFDTLLRQRRDGTFEPALATRWTDTGTEITFELRQSVKFHDGTPFDADAVVLNLKRILDPATRSTKTAALASIRDVKATGPRTVTVTLKAADPLLLTQLAHEPGMIASPTALAKGADEFGRRPVGTGPFTFRQWRTKVQLTAERNKTYWAKTEEGTALPLLDKVVLRFVTEAKVLRAELSTGGVQLVRALPPEEYKQLADAPRVTIKDEGVRRNYYASLNVTKGPFRDPRVRAAFAMAVERRSVGKAAAGGDFDIAPSFATADDWFYDDSLAPLPYDTEKARATLDKAGLRGKVPITLVARRRAPDPTVGELLQSQLTAAGFAPKVEILEFQTQLERMRNQDFDAAILVIDIPRLDPSLTFDPYFASDGPSNWSGLKDSALDALLDKGLSTDDRAVRKQAYVDVQRRILENNYWVFLHQAKSPLIHSSDLKGVDLDVDGQWRLERARLGS
ncbi:ABC transporter substrate-binding protein [Streptomyces sp. adm13(2018)]|uniref:ABC transporter substrate-binding protein n=1 Tax=Streptomyces sp. adm13(2018) TaxID=2479007 RepID=UPI0011CDA707|nr:ABC transporter substrate-binding protein [Streptomyces sp. adm13(2018)]TXS16016.1 ABC transporter substrate-binding protein [Streptomyces sp. adm13(2018)]